MSETGKDCQWMLKPLIGREEQDIVFKFHPLGYFVITSGKTLLPNHHQIGN